MIIPQDQKKGGVGIERLDDESFEIVVTMAQDIENEMNVFQDACDRYQAAIVGVHRVRRKLDMEREIKEKENEERRKRMGDSALEEMVEPMSDDIDPARPAVPSQLVVDRWSQELVNRRQYLNFLRGLYEEASILKSKITQLYESIKGELRNIAGLVSDRSSVPKEVVYPRFDALGALWVSLSEEYSMLKARSKTLQGLTRFRLSFQPTLSEEAYIVSALSSIDDLEEASVEAAGEGHKVDTRMSVIDSIKAERAAQVELQKKDKPGASSSAATLLTLDDTPDFMLLPLELQGYCPWTMVNAKGLLVAGKPNLGVVRYNNAYYVCDHNVALTAFLKDPELHLTNIKARVVAFPEYIHLLRVQNWFPSVSIARLLVRNP